MTNEDLKSSRFFSLYTTVQGRLYSFLMVLLHNRSATEDVMQEVSTTMWEKLDSFQDGENFTAWAIAIARNKALEYLRANRKTRMIFQEKNYLELAASAGDIDSDLHERLQALDLCIKKLQADRRKLLLMRYKNNITVTEISQRLGCSPRLVYKRLSGIFGLLRGCINRTLASGKEFS
ncbi:MAG: sigma-70 family RNA polymerase sigma factor [Phycisphaerae bacterium]|nr:sigma-70 family RNA polymerase sigma factor [Phycisphaerae bacterium]